MLITGESGTGKELVAKALHEHSSRKNEPFIKINCAAIPKTLMESELFGYEKGAFTGATSSKPGRFELADGGTLFLDEIGEIPVEMQVKLLRAIQESEFERVGGLKTIKVDVRLITATNRDLEQEIKRGNFREDLYYRLNVVPLQIPPLRKRTGDIPLLVTHIIKKFNERLKKNDHRHRRRRARRARDARLARQHPRARERARAHDPVPQGRADRARRSASSPAQRRSPPPRRRADAPTPARRARRSTATIDDGRRRRRRRADGRRARSRTSSAPRPRASSAS